MRAVRERPAIRICRGRRPRRPVASDPQQKMDMIRHDDKAIQGAPCISFFYFLQRFSNGFPVWQETDARDVEDAVPYGEDQDLRAIPDISRGSPFFGRGKPLPYEGCRHPDACPKTGGW